MLVLTLGAVPNLASRVCVVAVRPSVSRPALSGCQLPGVRTH
jgi:hypothetical protein